MARRLTRKQKAFADNFIDNRGNGTEAIIKAEYDVKNRATAGAMAWENLRKPNIIEYLQSHAPKAASNIVKLGNTAKNEAVRLQANRDILDRVGYKPTEKMDVTSKGEKVIGINYIKPDEIKSDSND